MGRALGTILNTEERKNSNNNKQHNVQQDVVHLTRCDVHIPFYFHFFLFSFLSFFFFVSLEVTCVVKLPPQLLIYPCISAVKFYTVVKKSCCKRLQEDGRISQAGC